jgi:23S rRNA pseudouridine1911/1915/1917 synthase
VGDSLYGAPRLMQPVRREADSSPFDKLRGRNDRPKLRNDKKEPSEAGVGLERNFLHAAHLEFAHPQTGKAVVVDAPLPRELAEFLARLRTERI